MSKLSGSGKSITEDVDESHTYCGCSLIRYIKAAAKNFYKSITYPKYFLIFNLICIAQTVPALYYYITFFQNGFYIINSTGMAPVWGCTIGAIATAIVGSALVPIPPNTITSTFCAAVILWEFLVSVSLFIAAVCLAAMFDFHGFAWSIIGSISTGYAGYFLLWLGLQVLNRQKEIVHEERNLLVSKIERCESLKSLSNLCSESKPIRRGSSGDMLTTALRRGSSGDVLSNESGTVVQISNGEISLKSTGSEYSKYDTSRPVESPIDDANGGLVFRLASSTKLQDDTPPEETQKSQLMVILGIFKFVIIQTLLWSVLFVFAVIPAGFGIQQAVQLSEARMYKMPGTLYPVPSAENSTTSVKMHIYCMGANGIRPTIVLEAETGMSGFALFNMQNALSSKWRICTYDRGGYGWSSLPPLGSATPKATAYRLNTLLKVAGEGQTAMGIVLVGHGGGGEVAQTYALLYPSRVSGLALLDAYANIDRLQGFATDRIYQATLKTCGNLQISRALESVAVMRAVTGVFSAKIVSQNDQFTPSSQFHRYMSTQTNGRYYAAQYNDLCVNAGAPTAYTDYLNDAAGGAAGLHSPYFTGNNVVWPPISAGKPVLIVSAGNTIHNKGADSAMYLKQAVLYNETLSVSKTSKWVVCDYCDHSLAYDSDSTAVAADIDQYFSLYY